MSFNALNQTFDELQDAINDCQTDVTKFVEGNNSAGTRIRKAMQVVKRLAQDVELKFKIKRTVNFNIILLNEERELFSSLFFYITIYLVFPLSL